MTNTLENLRSAGISAESPQAGRSEADRPPASRDDVAAFQRAMRGEADEARRKTSDERSAFSQKTGEGERTETSSRARTDGETARGARPDDAMMTDPDARKAQDFLASLFRGVGGTGQVAEGTAQTAGPAAAEGAASNEALETLVSRILVSRPESGKTEVRLQIQDAVLKNTEITLARDAGGQLTVRIHTNDAAAFQTIVSARAELEARLSGRETLPVLVELQKETDREENDARRESRGRGLFDESAQW